MSLAVILGGGEGGRRDDAEQKDGGTVARLHDDPRAGKPGLGCWTWLDLPLLKRRQRSLGSGCNHFSSFDSGKIRKSPSNGFNFLPETSSKFISRELKGGRVCET